MTQSIIWANKPIIARHLGVGQRTINSWMRKGLIPYVKTGDYKQAPVRFNIEAVDRALVRLTNCSGRDDQ